MIRMLFQEYYSLKTNKFFLHRRVIEKIDQTEFEGFEYVNPLLMSMEDTV